MDQTVPLSEEPAPEPAPFDYTYVSATARIALYDDLRSAPRVSEIQPAETSAYIENLASKVYEQARTAGGSIPYTVIREVSENFIHARFKEIIVSILDNGNTIRFADQGPGINHKDKAQLPGFSSAIEPMKKYIRGVGSGLPIVKEYLEFSHGKITIEDNMGAGSVVTISMGDTGAQTTSSDAQIPVSTSANTGTAAVASAFAVAPPSTTTPLSAQTSAAMAQQPAYPYAYAPQPQMQMQPQAQPQPVAYGYPQYAAHEASRIQMVLAPLSQRERDFLPILLHEGPLGVTDLVGLTGTPNSSTYNALRKLEEAGLVEKIAGQKRTLTPLGREVAQTL